MDQDAVKQVDYILSKLKDKKEDKNSPKFVAACSWLNQIGEVDVRRWKELMNAICETFDVTQQDVYSQISGIKVPGTTPNGHGKIGGVWDEDMFDSRLPKDGWLRHYVEYTRYTEAPMSYHVFSSLCLLGSSLGARVYIPKGFFNIWMNYCVMLIGPPAIAKTSAAEIAKKFISKEGLCPIFPDKITPEALAASMKEYGTHQFLYAPELSVFFGRQKYNVGLVELMNRLLDGPVDFKMRTIGRGEEVIPGQVSLTVLGASTPSLLASATPTQTSSGGFLSRFVIVVERRSQREFWQPLKGSKDLENKLSMTLDRMKQMNGEITYEPEADAWGKDWYAKHKQRMREHEDEAYVDIASRLATPHLERTASLIHLADCGNLRVCRRCFEVAGVLMEYVLQGLPQIVTSLRTATRSQDTEYVLECLKRAGGACDHSRLLRMCGNRGILAAAFKQHIETLTQSHIIRHEKRGNLNYYIMEEV